MATTMKLIGKQTLGAAAASVSFSSIPGTYTDLMLLSTSRATGNNAAIALRINSDTGTTYTWRNLQGNGSSAASITQATFGGSYNTYIFAQSIPSTATANTFDNGCLYIPNYAGSTNKSVSWEVVGENNGTSAYISLTAGLWSNTAAITALTVLPDPGGASSNLATDSSFFLYGITKA